MGLSSDLISQFVKVTNDAKKTKKDVVLYGTIRKIGEDTFVQLDGSDLLTPYESATEVQEEDRVSVTVKNHTLTATGNVTAGATNRVANIAASIPNVDKIVADTIVAQNATIGQLVADSISAEKAEIEELIAEKADIDDIEANYINVKELNAETGTIGKLFAEKANIKDLEAEYANIKFTNINFANIDKGVFKELYVNSGIIKNAVVDNQQITGELVGVTITGDLIKGNTIYADKLVIKGENGLYYKINADAMGTTAEEIPMDGIHGSVIVAKSITATQIAVEDLVAFDATIGGFHITEDSLYSGVKESATNGTRGIFMNSDGEFACGDGSNYLKYYKDDEGNYQFELACAGVASTDDLDELSKDFNTTINEQNTSIMSDCSAIITNALTEYIETGDFEAYKNTVESQIKQMSDEITFSFNTTITSLTDTNTKLESKLESFEKYFTFNQNGIGIKDACGDNTAELRLDTGIISFMKNGEQYGWWDGTDFHTGNIIVDVNERAQFGNFAFIPRSDGSLSFLKVADNIINNEPETPPEEPPTEPTVNNIFTSDMVGPEPNVASMDVTDNNIVVTVNSADESALYMPLDPSKTYRLRYTGTNVGFTSFDEDWNSTGSCDSNTCDITITGCMYSYFYILSFDDSNTYTISNIIIEEVS